MFVYAATPEVPEINFQGLDVHIEWPKGSTRTGFDEEGHAWKREMSADYGYVNETSTSADGESLDVYVGPDHEAPEAYVISQNTKEGEYDEFKVMLGCRSQEEAVALYRKHYPPELDLVGDVWPITVERLKELVGKSRGSVEKTARFLQLAHEGISTSSVFPLDEFVQGKCHVFALALNKTLGFPIYIAWDDDEDALIHACAKRPDGSYVDASGTITEEDAMYDHGDVGDPDFFEVSPAEVEKECTPKKWGRATSADLQKAIAFIRENRDVYVDGTRTLDGDDDHSISGKTASFLQIDEVRAAGRAYMASEEFKAVMAQVASGKDFKDLTFEEMDRFNMLSQKR